MGAITTDAEFNGAAQAQGGPAPQAAGGAETFTVAGLAPGTTYFFGLKAADEAGNISGLSNSPMGVTTAAPKDKYEISGATVPTIVIVNTYSSPLVSLVRIFNTTTPASGVGVDFSISTCPVGAIGQSLTKSSETTSAQGFADVMLKLGNIPAEYGVTATCKSCEASVSSVTFTCCGKLPNDHFSQGDPAWSTHTYANSSNTIQARGCALTSLATLSNYYRIAIATAIPNTNPGALNINLRNNNGYDARNNINWVRMAALSNGHVRWTESTDIDELTTHEDIVRKADREILAGRPIILRVRHLTSNGSYSTHFVLGIGKCGSNYIISDPGDRNREIFNPTDPNFTLQGVRMFAGQ